jgi:hypothetical protein
MKALKYLSLLSAIACFGTAGLRAEGDAKPEHKPDAPKRERGGDKERPERPKLSDEEHAKIKAAREAAEKDSAVIAAKEAFEKAREAKDRKAAMEARKTLGEAFKAAMLKADPSLSALIEKHPGIAAPMGARGEGRGEGRGERGPRKGGDKPAEKPAPTPAK